MEFSSCLTRGSSLRHSPATPSSSLRITKIGTSKVPISSFRSWLLEKDDVLRLRFVGKPSSFEVKKVAGWGWAVAANDGGGWWLARNGHVA
ncbi:unnamed protein product [Prunus armeniaca]|uniref:Uncharacterized protein n=1 Tax=Prunus armeniaca TaxID=36596 RepID=A0A6J5WEY8_PRUAR|nr:unnamed protein product [Prunus armeniaca]